MSPLMAPVIVRSPVTSNDAPDDTVAAPNVESPPSVQSPLASTSSVLNLSKLLFAVPVPCSISALVAPLAALPIASPVSVEPCVQRQGVRAGAGELDRGEGSGNRPRVGDCTEPARDVDAARRAGDRPGAVICDQAAAGEIDAIAVPAGDASCVGDRGEATR